MMQAIEDAKQRPFEWGVHDCCLFAASTADKITVNGDYVRRLLAQFNYASDISVDAILLAGGGLQKILDDFLGASIPWGQAQQGDVVLIRDARGQEILGVCEGSKVICATEGGVIPIAIRHAICAWRIN